MYRFILVIYLFFQSATIRNKSKRILTDNRERGLAMDVHTHTRTLKKKKEKRGKRWNVIICPLFLKLVK